MRPAQILEERLLLRTFFSTISLWVSLLMDKGSSIVKRFSRISGQHQTFAAASDIFRSIFLKRKSELTYTEKWKIMIFQIGRKEKEQKLPSSSVHNVSNKACYSWAFQKEPSFRTAGRLCSYFVSTSIRLQCRFPIALQYDSSKKNPGDHWGLSLSLWSLFCPPYPGRQDKPPFIFPFHLSCGVSCCLLEASESRWSEKRAISNSY